MKNPLRGLRETARIGQRHEIPQVPQFNALWHPRSRRRGPLNRFALCRNQFLAGLRARDRRRGKVAEQRLLPARQPLELLPRGTRAGGLVAGRSHRRPAVPACSGEESLIIAVMSCTGLFTAHERPS